MLERNNALHVELEMRKVGHQNSKIVERYACFSEADLLRVLSHMKDKIKPKFTSNKGDININNESFTINFYTY